MVPTEQHPWGAPPRHWRLVTQHPCVIKIIIATLKCNTDTGWGRITPGKYICISTNVVNRRKLGVPTARPSGRSVDRSNRPAKVYVVNYGALWFRYAKFIPGAFRCLIRQRLRCSKVEIVLQIMYSCGFYALLISVTKANGIIDDELDMPQQLVVTNQRFAFPVEQNGLQPDTIPTQMYAQSQERNQPILFVMVNSHAFAFHRKPFMSPRY